MLEELNVDFHDSGWLYFRLNELLEPPGACDLTDCDICCRPANIAGYDRVTGRESSVAGGYRAFGKGKHRRGFPFYDIRAHADLLGVGRASRSRLLCKATEVRYDGEAWPAARHGEIPYDSGRSTAILAVDLSHHVAAECCQVVSNPAIELRLRAWCPW